VNGQVGQAIHGPIPFLEENSIVTPQATGTARRRPRDFLHPANRAMRVALAASVALALPAAFAQDAGRMDEDRAAKAFATKPAYSPYAGRSYPTRPYFGDTHLHTSFSMDAGAFGARLTPRDVYRFARGEEVVSSTGQPVRLSRTWENGNRVRRDACRRAHAASRSAKAVDPAGSAARRALARIVCPLRSSHGSARGDGD
jgi:hypothetical protein